MKYKISILVTEIIEFAEQRVHLIACDLPCYVSVTTYDCCGSWQ
jgi:hypothetical protein